MQGRLAGRANEQASGRRLPTLSAPPSVGFINFNAQQTAPGWNDKNSIFCRPGRIYMVAGRPSARWLASNKDAPNGDVGRRAVGGSGRLNRPAGSLRPAKRSRAARRGARLIC